MWKLFRGLGLSVILGLTAILWIIWCGFSYILFSTMGWSQVGCSHSIGGCDDEGWLMIFAIIGVTLIIPALPTVLIILYMRFGRNNEL